jgi:hypothetical protein
VWCTSDDVDHEFDVVRRGKRDNARRWGVQRGNKKAPSLPSSSSRLIASVRLVLLGPLGPNFLCTECWIYRERARERERVAEYNKITTQRKRKERKKERRKE